MINTNLTAKSLTSTDDTLIVSCRGFGAVGIQISQAFTGTVSFKGSVNGETYGALTVATLAGSSVTSATAVGQWVGNCAGLSFVQAVFSTPTSGSPRVTINPVGQGISAGGGGAAGSVTQGTTPWIVAGEGTAGTAATGVVTVQGIASGTAQPVSYATTGSGNATGAIRVELPTNGTGVVGLNAGTALVGKVGLDQTTPGTTNAVSLAQIGATTVVNGGLGGTLAVGGSVATNVAITTNPVNNGAQGVSAENAAVTTGRMVQLVSDLVGKLIVLPYSNPENMVSFPGTAAMTGTVSTITLAAPPAGLRNYITAITVSNGSSTIPTDIIIQDGNGGTTLYTVPAPIGAGTGTGTSGGHYTFPSPIRQTTTATAIYVANVTTGSSTKVSMSGYKGA